ncbi:MAG: hypothetical protein LBP61_00550 [Desulfovibrio sp.]|jgi:hypothetical protein|nr:hypothetical protein [Desulfovibrio sp.]
MVISSISESTVSSLVESLYGKKSKSASSEENSSGVFSWGEDTVSISSEAIAKLAVLAETVSGEDAQAQTGSASGSGGGSGSSGESDSKVESLKAKLSALQASLGQATGLESAAVSAQIAQVMAEIAALESGTA